MGNNHFPGGPVVKNPSANAGGGGLIPDLGRPHMPWDMTTKAKRSLCTSIKNQHSQNFLKINLKGINKKAE